MPGNYVKEKIDIAFTQFDSSGRGPATGQVGMVSSGHPLATAAGLASMLAGGNAFDAVVTMAAVIAVVEPSSNHVGGDAFAIFQAAGAKELKALNASGPSPRATDSTVFHGRIPQIGLRSASVPGAVDAWDTLVTHYCRFDFPTLLQPAIDLAQDGFPISHALSSALHDNHHKLRASKTGLALFYPNGKPLAPGEILIQHDLATTLQIIAKGGSSAFYRGQFADSVAAWARNNDAWITRDDLANYHCEILDPLCVDYRGYQIIGQPPVSQGYVLLNELNIMNGFNIGKSKFGDSKTVHAMIEAKKLAFADRHAFLGDPAYTNFDISSLLSEEFAASRRTAIDPFHAANTPAAGIVNEGNDTTAIAAVDAEGNAITYIQSLFEAFGCGVIPDGTGVLFNNRMTGFSLEPSAPNFIQPNKRTMHTLNTYMVLNQDRLLLLGGTPGGHYQVQTNFQVISNVLDHGMNVQQAVEAPRWGHDERTGIVGVETRFPGKLADELHDRGHMIHSYGAWGNPSCAQLIAINPDNGSFTGGSDPRWHGQAIGY